MNEVYLTKERFNLSEEEFKKQYCQASGITEECFDASFVVLPCKCGYDTCEGWAVVGNSKLEINIHNDIWNRE